LYLFCDERYRDDGPSFVKFRTAVDEVYNLVASQLRAKREHEPDPVEPAIVETEPAAPQSVTPALAETLHALHDARPEQIEQEPMAAAAPGHATSPNTFSTVDGERAAQQKPEPLPIGGTTPSEPQSWEMAVEHIRQCAAYLSKERPASPVPYLLLGALHCGAMREPGYGLLQQPPSTDLRMALKRTSRESSGQLLLEESLRALALPDSGSWLDLHRYIWSASRDAGYQAIANSVLDVMRVMLRYDDAIAESFFEDDTPRASQETREWIETEVLLPERSLPALEEVAAPDAAQSLPALVSTTEQALTDEDVDVCARAEALAADGELAGSMQLLMKDADANPARRVSFRRRLQASRLCLAHGQKVVARHLLGRLLAEADEHRLELWEGPQLVAEVIAMLLQSLDENQEPDAERSELLARLCQIDPVRALSVEVRT
jgi:type VI secretion system protein ImpA